MKVENFTPLSERSEEDKKRIAKMGGIQSGIVRKRKKTIKQITAMMLERNISDMEQMKSDPEIAQLSEMIGDEEQTLAALMVAGQIRSATQGNTKAFVALTEMHEKEQKSEEKEPWRLPITDITSDFVEVYRTVHEAFETGSVREIVSKGGRGSIKSNFWAGVSEETIYNDPQAHVVYTRRYKTDLRGSVYNQFMKTVIRHNKLDEWDFTTSPMMAKYKSTGQCVIFVGCDKPISLKSYNLSFGYVKLLIHEECDEMAGIEQMDSVEDTFLRSDINAIDVKVFNPPKSANNFMNEYVLECANKPGTKVFHSYYYNVPVKWLGQRFFDRAEWLKQNKPRYYANNYMGEVTGTGGTIFENLELRTITDEEIKAMDNLRHGLDFGYEHPQAFTETSYDRETDTVYILFEKWSKRMRQDRFAKALAKYKRCEIIADSARPDNINDWNDFGFEVIGATKRWKGGGRDYAWEWLQMRRKIVIDPARTPHCAKEFKTAEHEQLKDGSFSSKYPELDEDCIMSVIYGLNRDIMDEKTMYDYDDEESEDDWEDE